MQALKLTVLTCLVASVALAADAQPEFVTKEVTGEASIENNNRDRALQDAKNAALREAVEQVVGVSISSTTLTSNSQLITDKILAKVDGYVRDVQVLEKKEERGVMKVKVRAQVGSGRIDRDLQAMQALVQQLGNRKLIILLYEQTATADGKSLESQTMSTVLTEAFSKDGWTLIDPNFAQGKVRLQPGITTLSTAEAKELGDLTQADYILYGNVTYRYHAPQEGGLVPELNSQGKQLVFFVSGEYNLAFFATDSGTQIAKVAGKFGRNPGQLGKNTSTQSISYDQTARELTQDRSSEIIESVRAPIGEYLRNAMFNGSRVVVRLNGGVDYGMVQGFMKVLSQSVSEVRQVGQATLKDGKARFDVTLVGTADTLAEAVSGKTFQGKKISVTGVTGNTIEITLAR